MAPSLKTHCKNNHEFTPVNTVIIARNDRGPGKTQRRCKTCLDDYQKQWFKDTYTPAEPRESRTHCDKGHEYALHAHVKPSGVRSCRLCTNQRERDQRKIQDQDIRRAKWLKYKYKITIEQFNAMLEAQNGLCAICERPEPRGLRVDHDHATGKVRGLLCHHCNVALGHMQDDTDRLKSMIRYLKERDGR